MSKSYQFKVSSLDAAHRRKTEALPIQRKSKSFYLAHLKECIDSKDLNRGRTLHTQVADSGYDLDGHVSSRLVKMYSKCGSMAEARTVFDRLANPSLIAWNILIKGYVENGESETALRLVLDMERQGLSPNTWTFVALLKACVSAAEKEEGRKLDGKLVKVESLKKSRKFHSQARRTGSDLDMFVANTLMDAYSNCGSMPDCRAVFDEMPVHDVVTWNTLILGYSQNGEEDTALQLFLRMLRGPDLCRPDARTFVAVLKACTGLSSRETECEGFLKMQSLERAMAVHAEAARRGFCSDIFVASCLIDLYAKCGRMSEARGVFERMESRNVVTWTALLTGYAEKGDTDMVFRLFELMHGECTVNARTLLAALKACGGASAREEAVEADGRLVKLSSLEKVVALDAYVQGSSSKSNLLLENSLVDLYAKCGSIEDSKRVFDGMLRHDVVSWNSLLQGLVENGEAEAALWFFNRMTCEPDERTFLAALKACGSLAGEEEAGELIDGGAVKVAALELGMAVHSRYLQCGFRESSDTYVANTAMDTYFKCGSAADARRVFDAMERRNLISWTIAMLGHAEHGEGEVSLELFLRLRSERPLYRDTGLYIAALKACSSVSVLEYGKAVHGELCRYGLDSAANVGSSLVDFYGKCGAMVSAEQVFDCMVRADVVAWTALLTGFSRRGDTGKVFERFERLREHGLRPVGVTFLAVLAACSHAGLVERGRRCFESMREFGVEPEIDHYHCLVDLLGRANRVESALEVMRSMPFRANAVSWTTLLAACRKWNNADVARESFQEFLSLDNEQQASAAYVLMRNMSINILVCE